MMQNVNICNLQDHVRNLEPPVLIVSTVVGRGMYTMGDAIREMVSEQSLVSHIPIESLLEPRAVNEDMVRYRFISCNFPVLLNLVYRFPLIYARKYYREKWFPRAAGKKLAQHILSLNIKTVICISHRPAFWSSLLKTRQKSDFKIWGILGEYGSNPGWKYIFWESMDGFLSPLSRDCLKFEIPGHVRFHMIELPARQEYARLADHPGDKNHLLLVCGYWGQGPFSEIIDTLTKYFPNLHIHVVCGENEKLYRRLSDRYRNQPRVHVNGVLVSLLPLMKQCAGIITKPGISTLLEAHAAGRKIFLINGMPVAEDNNARHALKYFAASRFTLDGFREWMMDEK